MKAELEKFCKILWDEPLAPYTTFKLGGKAKALALPESLQELADLVTYLTSREIPWLILGRGSNVLVSDKGVAGVVILLGDNLSSIEIVQEDARKILIKAQGGCSLSRLLNWAVERELSGLEFTVGIPGSLGGGILMNCGAWGEKISDILTSVTVMARDGSFSSLPKEKLAFRYRSWGGDDSLVIAEGFLQLSKSKKSEILKKCRELQKLRLERQPAGKASGGCFFRNPAGGKTAGQLIEEAGLKGMSVGSAQVSELHANFIINNGGSRASDVLDLVNIVRRKVEKQSSIVLDPEVKFIG